MEEIEVEEENYWAKIEEQEAKKDRPLMHIYFADEETTKLLHKETFAEGWVAALKTQMAVNEEAQMELKIQGGEVFDALWDKLDR